MSCYSRVFDKAESIELRPGGPVVALNIPIGQWHTVRALEGGMVLFEAKDRKYRPLSEDEIYQEL